MDPLRGSKSKFIPIEIPEQKRRKKENDQLIEQATKDQLVKSSDGNLPQKKLTKKITPDSVNPTLSKKVKAAKAKEFESFNSKRKFPNEIAKPVLRRQLSSPDLHHIRKVSSKQEKMDAKTGEVWSCVNCEKDLYGGEIFTFRLKDEYDPRNPKGEEEYQAKVNKMFPAVELPPQLLDAALNYSSENSQDVIKRLGPYFPSEKSFDNFLKEQQPFWKWGKELNALGYSYTVDKSGSYFTVPSHEALIARWEKLRENTLLPKLDVAVSEGIADDMAFVEAYFIHDALLSTGKEFLHDHMAHLIPTICVILGQKDGARYDKGKFALYQVIQESYRKLLIAKETLSTITDQAPKDLLKAKKHFNQMEAALGAFIDLQSTGITLSENGKPKIERGSMKKHISNLTTDELWKGYWERRFGDTVLDPTSFKKLWKLIGQIEYAYDKVLKLSR